METNARKIIFKRNLLEKYESDNRGAFLLSLKTSCQHQVKDACDKKLFFLRLHGPKRTQHRTCLNHKPGLT